MISILCSWWLTNKEKNKIKWIVIIIKIIVCKHTSFYDYF